MGDDRGIRRVVIAENPLEASAGTPVSQLRREITPEIVSVLQAAANEFVGKRVRIVSIKVLPASNTDSDVWLQRESSSASSRSSLLLAGLEQVDSFEWNPVLSNQHRTGYK